MVDKKKKGGMAKRYARSYEKKDTFGTSKGGAINYRAYDGEITFFNPVEGKNRINIIPYVIKSKNHPLVKSGEAEIGEKDYVLDFYAHRGVGPAEKTVLCLKNTYGKPCPICEQSAKLRKDGKEKEANALKPSRRVIYNVEDLKEPGKIKVFETSHYLFEKELIEEARDDEEGGFVDFADEEEGKEIKFRGSKVQAKNMEYIEFKSFAFEDRDEPLDEDLIESAISFDELLSVPTYEEVEKILYGDDDESEDEEDNESEDEEDDDEEEKPSKSKSKSKSDDDDDEDDEPEEKPAKKPSKKVEDDDDEDDEPAPKKSSKKSKSKSDDDEEDDDEEEKPSKSKSKSKSYDDEDDNDEEEEKPSKSKSKSKRVEEDDDEDEPEEKPAKKSKSKSCEDCPFGHKFGKDCDEYSECDDCDIWDKCIKASE